MDSVPRIYLSSESPKSGPPAGGDSAPRSTFPPKRDLGVPNGVMGSLPPLHSVPRETNSTSPSCCSKRGEKILQGKRNLHRWRSIPSLFTSSGVATTSVTAISLSATTGKTARGSSRSACGSARPSSARRRHGMHTSNTPRVYTTIIGLARSPRMHCVSMCSSRYLSGNI